MSEGRILTRLAGDGGLEITLDNPAAGNLLTHAMTEALAAALDDLPPQARFVLLQGAGTDFCAGRASPMPPPDSRVTAERIRREVAEPVLAFYDRVRCVPLPVLAVVRGRAHGVGCALAGLADLVIAEQGADFRIPEMDRDIPPLLVMTALADRLPRAALADLVLARESLDAAGAVAIGLASRATAPDRTEAVLAGLRAGLAGNSPTVLATVKRFLNAAPALAPEARRELAAAAISAAVSERFLPSATTGEG